MNTAAPREPTSQATYTETAYEDSSWEVVGQFVNNNSFVPMEVQAVAARAQKPSDPMFADYGGTLGVTPGQRWKASLGAQAETKGKDGAGTEIPSNKVMLAPEELEAQLGEAFAAGKETGMIEAVEQNTQKMADLENRIKTIIQDLGRQVTENLQAIQKQSLDLSLAISQKIISFAVDINPEYIAQIVSDAIAHSGSAKIKKVKVSPQDMEFIQVVGVAKSMKEFDGTWEFEADASVKAGCIVETSAGEIDFQLDKAWERARDMIVKVTRS